MKLIYLTIFIIIASCSTQVASKDKGASFSKTYRFLVGTEKDDKIINESELKKFIANGTSLAANVMFAVSGGNYPECESGTHWIWANSIKKYGICVIDSQENCDIYKTKFGSCEKCKIQFSLELQKDWSSKCLKINNSKDSKIEDYVDTVSEARFDRSWRSFIMLMALACCLIF